MVKKVGLLILTFAFAAYCSFAFATVPVLYLPGASLFGFHSHYVIFLIIALVAGLLSTFILYHEKAKKCSLIEIILTICGLTVASFFISFFVVSVISIIIFSGWSH